MPLLLTVMSVLACTFPSVTSPSAVKRMSPCVAVRLVRLTSLPGSVLTRRILLAYIPPNDPVSIAFQEVSPSPAIGTRVPRLKSIRLGPCVSVRFFACTLPLSIAARLIISTSSCAVASSPFSSKVMAPFFTSKAANAPSLSNTGLPVDKVTAGVLIKPQPLQVMPFGLAMKTAAFCPTTSNRPCRFEAKVPTTSLIINSADLPLK
ncbi:hypothetical protein Ppb6_00846 [Photorhabdus australis subsp. thailandensis]|uniref:Uncharacterized protein n=1 Tax=Photorhabdus australis subsp. thailandensis TaxID=2805096 RepID=A0A1C0U7D6_9GAMM|nr:hypothetical protein Ppb6_00846 [Photorhabdus australis subsp. thailandensis]